MSILQKVELKKIYTILHLYSKSSVFINSKRVQFNLQEAAEAVVIQFHKFDIFYYSFLQNIDTHHVHILQSIDFLTF